MMMTWMLYGNGNNNKDGEYITSQRAKITIGT